MNTIISSYKAVSISSQWPKSNFSEYSQLKVGGHRTTIMNCYDYKTLIKFNLDAIPKDISSIEKAILSIFFQDVVGVPPIIVNIHRNEQEFYWQTVICNTSPNYSENCSKASVNMTGSNSGYINIDITEMVRYWYYGLKSNYGITICVDSVVGDNLLYIGKVKGNNSISINVEHTTISQVYGYFMDINKRGIKKNEIIYQGERQYSSGISTTVSKDLKPVLQFDVPGTYELDMQIGNLSKESTVSLLMGDGGRDIKEFTPLNGMNYSGEKQICITTVVRANREGDQLAVLADCDIEEGFYFSTTVKRLALFNEIVITGHRQNPFIGGLIQYNNYIIQLNSEDVLAEYGSEKETKIVGNVVIKGERVDKRCIMRLKNIIVEGRVFIDLGNVNVKIEDCRFSSIEIGGLGCSTIEFLGHVSIEAIVVSNRTPVEIKIRDDEKYINIDNISLSPISRYLEDTRVILSGNFGWADITVDRSILLQGEAFKVNRPVKVYLQYEKHGKFKVGGSFKEVLLKLIKLEQLIGDIELPPRGLMVENEEGIKNQIVLKGNLSTVSMNICYQCRVKFERAIVGFMVFKGKSEEMQCEIELDNASEVSLVETTAAVNYKGSLAAILKAIKNTIITKHTGEIVTEKDRGDFRDYNDLISAANNLDYFFVQEIRRSISLDALIRAANRQKTGIQVLIKNLENKDKHSDIFRLSFDKKRILYTPQIADEDILCKHEAELILELIKNGHSIEKRCLLKGKYINMYVNYQTESAFIQNDIRALKYSVANHDFSNIILLQDIACHNESISLKHRIVSIDLNRHKLHIDNICISDSEVYISKGILDCCKDLSRWKLSERNQYNFIWLDKAACSTTLAVEDVEISGEGFSFNSRKEGQQSACLIGCSSGEDKRQPDKIVIVNCSMEIKVHSKEGKAYILSSSGKINIVAKNHFYSSYGHLKFYGEQRDVFAVVVENIFNNQSKEESKVVTVVPYKGRGNVSINDVRIAPVESREKLRFEAFKLGEALIFPKNRLKKNKIEIGCRIEIWNDDSGKLIKTLEYNGRRWCENIPPSLIADIVDNDMQHFIQIRFFPQREWSDNITKVIVINSRVETLDKDKYEVDGIKGIITIYNVRFNEVGKPSFQNILEVDKNEIIIKAINFEDAYVVQTIRPIQAIEMRNGEGRAVMRIIDRGVFKLKAAVISNDKKIEIKSPTEVKIED